MTSSPTSPILLNLVLHYLPPFAPFPLIKSQTAISSVLQTQTHTLKSSTTSNPNSTTALNQSFYNCAISGLNQLIGNGLFSESAMACAILLGDIQHLKRDIKAWGNMLDMAVTSFHNVLKLHGGEESVFSTFGENSSQSSSQFAIFGLSLTSSAATTSLVPLHRRCASSRWRL